MTAEELEPFRKPRALSPELREAARVLCLGLSAGHRMEFNANNTYAGSRSSLSQRHTLQTVREYIIQNGRHERTEGVHDLYAKLATLSMARRMKVPLGHDDLLCQMLAADISAVARNLPNYSLASNSRYATAACFVQRFPENFPP